MNYILKEENGSKTLKKTKLYTEPEKIKTIADKTRWKILKSISGKAK